VHEAAEQFSRGITLDELDRLERDETRVSIVDGQLYGAFLRLHFLSQPVARPDEAPIVPCSQDVPRRVDLEVFRRARLAQRGGAHLARCLPGRRVCLSVRSAHTCRLDD